MRGVTLKADGPGVVSLFGTHMDGDMVRLAGPFDKSAKQTQANAVIAHYKSIMDDDQKALLERCVDGHPAAPDPFIFVTYAELILEGKTNHPLIRAVLECET